MANYPKYDEDYYGWIIANAQLMREGKISEVDMENLIEEIESMGRSEKNELVNRLAVLITHLLKWRYQPQEKGHSWLYTTREQRSRIKDIFLENPSLQTKSNEAFAKAYKYARFQASRETGLVESNFPTECPFSFEQCLDDGFYPE